MLLQGLNLAHTIFPQGGTCLEFGVGWGISYSKIAKLLCNKYLNSKLTGFDSWQGLPEETSGVWYPDRHRKGNFCCNKFETISKIKEVVNIQENERFDIIDGFLTNTCTPELRNTISNLIFVNIDVDIHSSTLVLLDFIKPLLQLGTILYFDDWKDPIDIPLCSSNWGEHKAWEDWSLINLDIKTEVLKVNRLNQHLMIVTKIKDSSIPNSEVERIKKLV